MNYSTALLSVQSTAAIISFAAGALVVSIVLFIILTSGTEEEKMEAKHKVYKVRGRYFFILTLCIIAGLFFSLRLLPYTPFQTEPDEVITVVARQWSWSMGPGDYQKKIADFNGNNEINVAVNKQVRFIVTSADVNHNFAIYSPKGDIVAQTQAMPQYRNELEHLFTEKGDYHILCLEYCGMAHAFMAGIIHVQ